MTRCCPEQVDDDIHPVRVDCGVEHPKPQQPHPLCCQQLLQSGKVLKPTQEDYA